MINKHNLNISKSIKSNLEENLIDHFYYEGKSITYKAIYSNYHRNLTNRVFYRKEENIFIIYTKKSEEKWQMEYLIKSKYDEMCSKPFSETIDINENTIYIFNEPITVKLIKSKRNSYDFLNNTLYLKLTNIKHKSKIVKDFIRCIGGQYIISRSKQLAKQLKIANLRNVLTEWYISKLGYCTGKDISLSLHLISGDKKEIDRVIYHELAHLTHMNHRKEFWDLLYKYCPDWQYHLGWYRSYKF